MSAYQAFDRVLLLPELVENISQFLGQIHLCQLRLTCKRLEHAFTPHVNFAVRQRFGKFTNPDFEILEKHGSLVRSLVLDIVGNESNIERVLETHRAIRNVKVRWWGINIDIIYKILETQSMLRNLTIELSGKEVETSIVELLHAIATKAPLLESLTLFIAMKISLSIPWANFGSLIDTSKLLQHLNFRGFTIEHQEAMTQFTQIDSLALSDVNMRHHAIKFLIQSMPDIRSLSIHQLQGFPKDSTTLWETLTGSIDAPNIILKRLTKLRIGARKSNLAGLTRFIMSCCPAIQDLELFSECQYIKHGEMVELLEHFNENGIQLKRLAIDYTPSSYIGHWIRMMLEEYCPNLEELQLGSGVGFMVETQMSPFNWRKSEDLQITDYSSHGLKYWFPFASTIRKLHLNAMFTQQLYQHSAESRSCLVNQMLRDMPLLDDLAIMDLFVDFKVLEGLGRCRAPNTGKTGNKKQLENPVKERPYLHSLKIGLSLRVGFNAEQWERELIHRFRYLERLTVRTVLLYPQMEQLLKWQESLRPDLSISLEHIEESRLQFYNRN